MASATMPMPMQGLQPSLGATNSHASRETSPTTSTATSDTSAACTAATTSGGREAPTHTPTPTPCGLAVSGPGLPATASSAASLDGNHHPDSTVSQRVATSPSQSQNPPGSKPEPEQQPAEQTHPIRSIQPIIPPTSSTSDTSSTTTTTNNNTNTTTTPLLSSASLSNNTAATLAPPHSTLPSRQRSLSTLKPPKPTTNASAAQHRPSTATGNFSHPTSSSGIIRPSSSRSRSKDGGALFQLLERPPFQFAIDWALCPLPSDSEPPSDPQSQLLQIPAGQRNPPSFLSASTPSSLPATPCSNRRPTVELVSGAIPEEQPETDETESDSPNEPLTPTSGSLSRDFHHLQPTENTHHRDSLVTGSIVAQGIPEEDSASHNVPLTNPSAFLDIPDLATPRAKDQHQYTSRPGSVGASEFHGSAASSPPRPLTASVTNQSFNYSLKSAQSRSSLRTTKRKYSSASLRRAMGLFRRSHSNSNGSADASPPGSATPTPTSPIGVPGQGSMHNGMTNGNGIAQSLPTSTSNGSILVRSPTSRRRFSLHRTFAATRSNTPSDTDATADSETAGNRRSMHSVGFQVGSPPQPMTKKNRASTGLSLRGRVAHFAHIHGPHKNEPHRRRTRSAEREKPANPANQRVDITRSPWALPPDQGTGMKARRLSLSLPDDFTVDIAELTSEFEYQSKFLKRHGKHLGKGATSKVTLMSRKGCPNELYAVKEFRNKNSHESASEYEGKIKSEYSIAKSLHHPNIVETIRLCTDHGRWNHVMEYCSEGDLFTLVSKKYLNSDERETDRLCLFKQLCQGIYYLHSHGIAHRDIKLENLLITKDSKLKITDFGVSEVFTGIHPGLREAGGQCGQGMDGEVRLCKPGICGSLPYIAPEVLSKKSDYDPRPLDVWSSAIVAIYLMFSAGIWEKADPDFAAPGSPYDELDRGWKRVNAKKEADPAKKDLYPKVQVFDLFVKSAPLRRIITNMLNPDPTKRWTMEQVAKHRWMKQIECCQLDTYDDPVKFIDATKKDAMRGKSGQKIFCHNHLPPVITSAGLPPMPGKPGY